MCETKRPVVYCLALLATFSVAHSQPLADPYTVWIASGGAKVYSGPGDDYYATQQLPAGTKCEVYEELRDGWLAIRPPEGSYSLVLRSALGPVQDGVAEITRDQTPARVGSVLADKYSSVHVRLDTGELVQVLQNAGDSETQWATIAPPAGEFRWIRTADVKHAPVERDPVETESSQKESLAAKQDGTDWRGIEVESSETAPIEYEVDDEQTIRVVTHDDPKPPEPPVSTSAEASATTSAVSSPASLAPVGTPFAKQLDQLEIQLSRRVAGPVNLWRFDDLERQAALLLGQANTATEQQAVSSLASRLARFAAIGQRYRTAKSKTDSTVNNIATADNSIAPDPALAQYDAVGVLRPVVSQSGNVPPYALVDDTGKIVTFITPSPTLNLQQHLGQRVGVSGTRGFLPQYQSRNIQTARVAPVAAPMRR